MNTAAYTIWIETGIGRRTLIASSACRTFAILVGEALWTHFGKIQATTLSVRMIEVQNDSRPAQPGVSRIIARWSPVERENLIDSHVLQETGEVEKEAVPSLTTRPSNLTSSASDQQASQATSPSLSAFFPTAKEWVWWKERRALDQ